MSLLNAVAKVIAGRGKGSSLVRGTPPAPPLPISERSACGVGMSPKERFEAAVGETTIWDKWLYEALILALEARRKFETSAGAERDGSAMMLMRSALTLLGTIVGPEALASIYGNDPPDDAPRQDHLIAAWRRLFVVSSIYVGPQHANHLAPSSLQSLAGELLALAKGDRSQLLLETERPPGTPVNSWQLAQRKITALEWEAYRRGRGETPAEAQNAVATAFFQTWDTIRKWKGPIVQALGKETLEYALEGARRGAGYFSSVGTPGIDMDLALQRDGEEYRKERRRSLELAGKE